MKIYLVRHAQAKTNLEGIDFDDKKNIGLTKKGKNQAKKLAKRLVKFKFDKIFISEAKRSYQTILPLIKLRPFPVDKDLRLNEAKFGIFSGLTFEKAKRKYPGIYEDRVKNKWDYRLPKGESFKDVSERLNSFLNDLKNKKFENILIVTHATVLKVFLAKYLKFSLEKADSIYFQNASISLSEIKNKKVISIIINGRSYLDNDILKSKRIHRG